MEPTTLVDCTLRDGGNLNAWRFDLDFVHRLLRELDAAGVQVVEVGYLGGSGSNAASSVGMCANVDSSFLAGLPDVSSQLAVMVVPTVCPIGLLDVVRDGPVGVIRVAAYPEDINAALPFVEAASSLATSTLNVMAASRLAPDELADVARRAADAGAAAMYLADSFGSMIPSEVECRVCAVREAAPVAVGFHGHDNLGLAFANALAALEAGATWVDASVCGMARGAGNLPTEQVAAVSTRWPALGLKLAVEPILDLAEHIQASVLPGPLPRSRREIETGMYNLHYYDYATLVEVSEAAGVSRDILARILETTASTRLDRTAVERLAAAFSSSARTP